MRTFDELSQGNKNKVYKKFYDFDSKYYFSSLDYSNLMRKHSLRYGREIQLINYSIEKDNCIFMSGMVEIPVKLKNEIWKEIKNQIKNKETFASLEKSFIDGGVLFDSNLEIIRE